MTLHSGELASLQVAFAPRLTATATVLRRMTVRDTSGGFTDSYVAGATYPCSFARYPMRPRDVPSSPRVQSFSEWYFTFPDGSDIRLTDRLKVGARTFEVFEAGPRSVNVTLLVVCMEII